MTLIDLLQHKGIRFQRSHRPGEIRLCCVFCNDTRFRLSVNTFKSLGHCYNCDWKSRHAIPRILRAMKLPTQGIDGAQITEAVAADIPQLPEGFHLLASSQDSMDNAAKVYVLKERRITREQMKRNRIGVTYFGRYAWRVVLPVFDGQELKGLVCRALTRNREPRYLNSSGEKSLYNLNAIRPTTVLVEGPFKSLRMEQMLQKAGIDAGAAALLGHSVTDLQMKQLEQHKVERLVLCPDPDRVGRRGMAEVGQKLIEHGLKVELMMTRQPADEASLSELFTSWKQRIRFDWGAVNRLNLPA